jgi:hypothetical protein
MHAVGGPMKSPNHAAIQSTILPVPLNFKMPRRRRQWNIQAPGKPLKMLGGEDKRLPASDTFLLGT